MAIKQQLAIGLGVLVLSMVCHTETVKSEDVSPASPAHIASMEIPAEQTTFRFFHLPKKQRLLLLTPQDKRQIVVRDLLLRPQDRRMPFVVPTHDSLAQSHSKWIQQER